MANDLRNTILVETKGIEDFLKFTKQVKKELTEIKKILQDKGFKGNEAELTRAAAVYRREFLKAIKDVGAANNEMLLKSMELQRKSLQGDKGTKAGVELREIELAIEVIKSLSKAAEDAESSLNGLSQSVENLNKEQQKNNKTKKDSAQLTKEELVALEGDKLKRREATQVAKQQAIILAQEKDTIASLRAQLSLTTLQWSKLTEEEIQNTDTGKFLNAEKTRLTEKLKVLEKATGDHRREVGNYTLAGNKAASMVSRLNLAGNKLTGVFGRLGRALDSVGFGGFALAAAAATIAFEFFKNKIIGNSDEIIQKNKELEESINGLKESLSTGFREGRFLEIDNSNISEAEKRLEKIKLLREDLGRLGVELSNKGAELQRVENKLIDDNFKTEIDKKQAQEQELQLKVKRNEIAKEIKATEAEINKLQKEGVEANKKAVEDAAEKRKKEQEQKNQEAQKEIERQRKIADELKKIEDSRLSAAEQFEAELRKIKIESLEDVTEKAIAIEKERFLEQQDQTRDNFLAIRKQRQEDAEKLKELLAENSEEFLRFEIETANELIELGKKANLILQQQEQDHQAALKKIKEDAEKASLEATEKARREEIEQNEKLFEEFVQNNESEAEEQIKKDVENAKTRAEQVESAITSSIQSTFDNVQKIMKIAADAENQAFEDALNQRQQRIDALNEDLQTATGAQRQFLERQIQQEKEAQKKLAAQAEQARKEQAEAQRAVAIVQAIVNTAVAVTQALGSAPPPASFILAGAAAAAGAVEIATIAASKFEKGGIVEGKSHAEGGVRASVKNSADVELEGGEIVINKKSAKMFRKELSQINVMGGGRKFQFGGDVSPNFAAIASSQDGKQRRTLKQLEQQQIFVNVTDISNMQGRVAQVVQQSSF